MSLIGVYYDKSRPNKPWVALINMQGRRKYLGRYAIEEEAGEMYREEHERLVDSGQRIIKVPGNPNPTSRLDKVGPRRTKGKVSRYIGR